ncbi:MAG: DUF5711 family protein [Oscillospiraceae bacterium]|nr:DUF5711 family protein [Oscillospiraceae bacterium]
MNREDRERLERRKRMLAREQGNVPIPQPAQNPQPAQRQTKRKNGTAQQSTAGKSSSEPVGVQTENPKIRSISEELRRRQRRRTALLVGAVVVLAAALALASGVLSTSIAMLGDLTDSVYLAFNRAGGGWPASTGIRTPLQVEELAGGFVELDGEDVAVYSAYGAKVRAFQPGYARPALAVGNTRFAVYNRAGSELTVQSRTRQLYAKNFSSPIMLCAMSDNGTLAVVTESDRYAAEVNIYDPAFRDTPYVWKITQEDGTPIAMDFAPDNRRFAAGTVAAKDGQLCTNVRFMSLSSDTAGSVYQADTGSMVLKLEWLSSGRLLAVFDTYITVLDTTSAAEVSRYDYGGSTLQSVSTCGKATALLLAVRGGNTLVTLNEKLTPLAMIPAGLAEKVTCTATEVYLLTDSGVESYAFDGVQNWSVDLGTRPQAVIEASHTLVFTPGQANILTGN